MEAIYILTSYDSVWVTFELYEGLLVGMYAQAWSALGEGLETNAQEIFDTMDELLYHRANQSLERPGVQCLVRYLPAKMWRDEYPGIMITPHERYDFSIVYFPTIINGYIVDMRMPSQNTTGIISELRLIDIITDASDNLIGSERINHISPPR
jgi:hypothetical protein